MTIFQFPQDFRWGTATASYQIEGARTREDAEFPSGIHLHALLAKCLMATMVMSLATATTVMKKTLH